MLVKDMRHKTAMRSEPLSGQHIGHTFFLLSHIPYMISICIHNNIFIGLLKTTVNQDHIPSAQKH